MCDKPKLIVHSIAEERAEYLRRQLANLEEAAIEMKKVPWWKLHKFLKYRLAVCSLELCIKPKIVSLINKYDIHATNPPTFDIGYTNMEFTNFLLTHKNFLINLNKLNGTEEDKFLEKL